MVLGFEHEAEAKRFWDAMRERLEKFALSLHPDKTRLIEFGRYAADNREKKGLGKPETFKFLGFTFISGKSKRGKFAIRRKTRKDRMRAKLGKIKEVLRRIMHLPIAEIGKWLGQVVRGYFNHHAVPTNAQALSEFRTKCRSLQAHAQKAQPEGCDDMGADKEDRGRVPSKSTNYSSLAKPALRRQTSKVGAVCGNSARTDLCGGRSVMGVPTAIENSPYVGKFLGAR